MEKLFWIFFVSLVTLSVQAQDSANPSKKITFSGYVKILQGGTFNNKFSELIGSDLVHNRINIKWKPSTSVTADAEFRNRLYWGEEVRSTPGFSSLLRNDNEYLNLQKAWISNNSLVLHTNTERLYLDVHHDLWYARFGRQRINWSMTTGWNPNDIFNTYSFLDFDYEERPGVDAALFRYTFGKAFSTELAYAQTGNKKGSTVGGKFVFNKWNYDMQFIAGIYKCNPTLGAGWAGNVKDAGFKGEMQYFFREGDSSGHFNAALEGDYMFKKGWYVNLGFLFNSRGLSVPVLGWDSINLNISPENLMPTKWNILISSAKEFTPLLSVNMSLLYSPGTNLLIFFPSVNYNLVTNLDISLYWQSFYTEIKSNLESMGHRCFIRLKWSF
jgi:hypothetical protein